MIELKVDNAHFSNYCELSKQSKCKTSIKDATSEYESKIKEFKS